MFCKEQELATVVYRFAGGRQDRFQTKSTPIQVTIKKEGSPPFSSGQCYDIFYTARFSNDPPNFDYSSFYSSRSVKGKILSIRLDSVQNNGFVQTSNYTATTQNIEGGIEERPGLQSPFASPNATPPVLIEFVEKELGSPLCGDPPFEELCTLEIRNIDSVTIFSTTGKCPCQFQVACGEECPPGTIKCFSINYPGYCCLPCSEIKGEIKAITSQIRKLNNG